MNNTSNSSHDISFKAIVGWGLGTLPVAIFFNSFNFLALRFFTDFVGLAAATTGIIIGLSKLYDAFSDPIMGFISDRTKSRAGRRRPYLLLGGFMCALSIFGIFSIPEGLDTQTAIWIFSLAVFLYATSYTIYNVPYMAMPSEITTRGQTRSALMSWRVASIGIGGMLAGALGPKIIAWGGGGAEGHRLMGMVLAGLIFAFAVNTFILTSDAPRDARKISPKRIPLKEKIKTVISNKPFINLLGLKLFQLMGVAMSSATLAFFVVWILGRGYSDLGTIILFTTAGQIIGTPLWLKFSNRFGKKTTFYISAILFSAASMSWLLATASEPMWITCLRVFIKGLAAGGILIVSQALLPDTIEYDRLRTNMRREGVLSGFYTTIEKVAFAIGVAATGLYLDAMNYTPGLRAETDVQPDQAITAIYFCQSVWPAVGMLFAMFFMSRIKLDDEILDNLRSEKSESPA